METSTENTGNTEMPKNPQPSEEVQLNIETVTPDTEKEVVPTPVSDDKNMDDQSQTTEQAKDDESEEMEQGDESDEKSQEENQGSDERDEVETVSP